VVANPGLNPLVAIIGETASGKSTLSLQLAQRFNGEIICADAWTIRQGADIGTAKPTVQERQLVKHHLVDIVGPNDSFSAASFKTLANEAIEEIVSRNKLPILAGGTGLYIDSVLYDYSFMPKQDDSQRAKLEQLSKEKLLKMAIDSGYSTEELDTNNKRRLIRLIETSGQKPKKRSIRDDTLVIGISIEREELKKRISLRLQNMIEQGLEDEVKRLIEQHGSGCIAMNAIGYHEWIEYFDGHKSKTEVLQEIEKNSLSLGRRQKTWFKRNKSIQWFSTPVNLSDIVELTTTFLNNESSLLN
jgi:tRNA dimethylallyltransferase